MTESSYAAHASQGVPLEFHPSQSAIPHPARYAWVLAGSYVVFGTLYIVVSTWLAASSAMSVEQMERLETWKGVAFITVTAALLFAFAYSLFARIRRQEELLARQNHALQNSERAILAGTFAGTIAHDINNALTASTFAVEELRAAVAPGSDEAKLAESVDQSLKTITEWNRRLFDLGSRRAGGAVGPVDVAKLVANCIELVRHHARLLARLLQRTRSLLRHNARSDARSGARRARPARIAIVRRSRTRRRARGSRFTPGCTADSHRGEEHTADSFEGRDKDQGSHGVSRPSRPGKHVRMPGP